MQVAKLKHYIERYKDHLRHSKDHWESYRWESLRHFQINWDVAAADVGAMYDSCLQNAESQRLWNREAWYPKEMMLTLIALDPDAVRSMFVNLFAEELPVHTRIISFREDCDLLLAKYLDQSRKPLGDDHFHGDNQMIFLYLAFRFPAAYTLYDYPAFREMMQLLGVANIPTAYELDRFVKLTQAMDKFLSRDEELQVLHLKRLDSKHHFVDQSMLLVHDFYATCARMEK